MAIESPARSINLLLERRDEEFKQLLKMNCPTERFGGLSDQGRK